MSSSRERRRSSRTVIARVFGTLRHVPNELSEQRERLVTQQELNQLRLAR